MNEKQLKALRVLRDHSAKKFEWNGMSDCSTFVRDMLQALHDKDFMEGINYSTEEEARELMRKHGGLVGVVNSILGKGERLRTEGQVLDLQDGDVVALLDVTGDWTLGIVFLSRIHVRTPRSTMDFPAQYAQVRWRI